jgi:hypothetical protein
VVDQLLHWLRRTPSISLESVDPPPRRRGFYTIGSPESVHETFMDMNNPTRDQPVHKKDMAKVLEDTNQGTPAQGDSCSFPFFGNIGAPLDGHFEHSWVDVGLLRGGVNQ